MKDEFKMYSLPSVAGLKFIENMRRDAQNTVERMRPFFDQAVKTHLQIQETIKPVLQAMNASRAIINVATQRAVFLLEPTFKKETFVLPLPRRYPSAEEVADVVCEKLTSHNEIKSKTIEIAVEKSVVILPERADWENLGMDFKNSHTLSVFYKDKLLGSYDYATLGFVRKNTRDGKPDKQWDFLCRLAIITEYKGRGRFTPTPNALASFLKTTQGGCEKIKENLSKKLRVAFGISSDPFYKYDPEVGYRLRFTVRPEPDLRGDGELHISGGKLIDRIAGDNQEENEEDY